MNLEGISARTFPDGKFLNEPCVNDTYVHATGYIEGCHTFPALCSFSSVLVRLNQCAALTRNRDHHATFIVAMRLFCGRYLNIMWRDSRLHRPSRRSYYRRSGIAAPPDGVTSSIMTFPAFLLLDVCCQVATFKENMPSSHRVHFCVRAG